ncbi:MAG: hypothetical protein ABFR75_01335 [Acidobacteriota bacterium]
MKKLLILLITLTFLGAIKEKYEGTLNIRLNEPVNFSHSTSNYSDTIFYSLIYENFFYLNKKADISSNIFSQYIYEKEKRVVTLKLKPNLSFSTGAPVTTKNIKYSLRFFLNRDISAAKKLSRVIRSFRYEGDFFYIDLNYNVPDILNILTAPELVLLSLNEQAFSGQFFPSQWERNKFMILVPNLFYPGGRSYLNQIKIVFYDYYYPDLYLGDPGSVNKGYSEKNSGIYQNIYLSFPSGKTGTNTKIALYSLLKNFLLKFNFVRLNSLTSAEESPVSVGIKKFSFRKIRTILRYSQIKLYISSSLKRIEKDLLEYLKSYNINISLVFIENSKLKEFIKSNRSVKFLVSEKLFNKKDHIEDKIRSIISELSFTRFNEKYLKFLKELEEIKNINNEELLIESVSNIVTTLINDEFVLPLAHKKFSLYINNNFKDIFMDYYGRPLMQMVKTK